MKRVKVKYIHIGEEAEGILFESLDDVKYLKVALKKAEKGVLTKFVKSGESTDRLNHIMPGFRPLEKAIAALAITRSSVYGQDSVYLLGGCSQTYIDSLSKQLIQGRQVFQNKAGGLCPVEGSLKILEVLEDNVESIDDKPVYRIKEGSKVINLENDWELENTSFNYMQKRFGSYSYIVDSKLLNSRQYKDIFNKFVKQGGEYVYVYTTGSDVEQMYEYSNHALEAGLSKFIFDFNRGRDKDIDKFINWLSQRAKVEVL